MNMTKNKIQKMNKRIRNLPEKTSYLDIFHAVLSRCNHGLSILIVFLVLSAAIQKVKQNLVIISSIIILVLL